jgi:calcium-independent phospholipase A2-gamma
MEDLRTYLDYASDYTAEKNTTLFPGDRLNRKPKFRRPTDAIESSNFMMKRRYRRDSRFRCKLYVIQLLLAMTVASDDAVTAIRETEGLRDTIIRCSSYTIGEQTRRWIRYPGELMKWIWKQRNRKKKLVDKDDTDGQPTESETVRPPFMEAANVANDLNGSVQRSANQLLAAIGHNQWIPKSPGQRGLRVLSLDGGGSRGISAITTLNYLIETVGNGADVSDLFDIIVGTSTGGIISFLVGLRKESSARAVTR